MVRNRRRFRRRRRVGGVDRKQAKPSANNSVALVEAGLERQSDPSARWLFQNHAQSCLRLVFFNPIRPGLGDRAIDWPRGKPLAVPHPSMVCCTSVSPKTMTVGGKWETKVGVGMTSCPYQRAENLNAAAPNCAVWVAASTFLT